MKIEYLSDLQKQYRENPVRLNKANKSPLDEPYKNQEYKDDTTTIEEWRKSFEEVCPDFDKDIECPGFGLCDFHQFRNGRHKYYKFYKIDWNNLDELKELWSKGNKLHKENSKVYIGWFFWHPFRMERKLPIRNDLDEFRLRCSVDTNFSPYNAWNDKAIRTSAELNLAEQIGFGGDCFGDFLKAKTSIELKILERFTIAKLAQRVTAMSPKEAVVWLMTSDYKKDVLQEQGFGKFRKGFYDPCAGFPGRSIAAAQLNAEYEGYDVNPMMIKYSNAKFRDLIMMDPVETDKVVFTSPPWENRETWPNDNLDACQGGGGDAENSFCFAKFWWYTLIMRKVKSSVGYLLVNGQDNSNQPGLNKRVAGLFGQRSKCCVTYSAKDAAEIRKLCDDEDLNFSIEDNNRAHEICLEWMNKNYDKKFKIE